MLAQVLSSAIWGIEAYPVEVEVDIQHGLPAWTTVGLPDTVVKESKERIRSAIKNCGYQFPSDRITLILPQPQEKRRALPLIYPLLWAS